MADAPPSLRLGIAFAAFAAIGAVEAALGVVLPSLLHTFALGPASVALLLASQIGGSSVAAVLSGGVSRRLGLGRMLALAFGLLTSALLLWALSPGWSPMVAAGAAVGLGIGLIDAGLNTAVARHGDGHRLIGPLHGFYGVGAVLGPAIATGLLALGGSWRLVYALLAALVALPLLEIWRHRAACCWRGAQTAAVAPGPLLGPALRSRSVQLAGLVLLAAVGLEACIGTWAFSVQHLARAQPALVAGLGVSLYWLGLSAGRFGFGRLVVQLGLPGLAAASLALLLLAQIAWALGIAPGLSLPLAGLALAGIFPATILLLPRRLPDPLVPTAVGLATSAASAGSLLLPSALGWLAGDFGFALLPALLVPLVLGLAGLWALLWTTATGPVPCPSPLPPLPTPLPWMPSD